MRRTARWLTAVNTISAPRVSSQRSRVDGVFDRMVHKAEHQAEADSAVAQEFVDSYRFLLREVAKQDSLSMVGWQGFIDDLTRRMTNHLRVERLIAEADPLLVDVMPLHPKPPNRPAGSVWVDKGRQDIPGSVWLPNTGYGFLPQATADWW